MFRNSAGERGVVLITVSILLVTLAALGSAFLLTSVGNSRLTTQQAELARAGVIAESGVDLALYELTYGGAIFGDTWDVADYHGGVLHVETRAQFDANGEAVEARGIIVSRATVRGVTSTVETTVYNDSYELHQLYYKAIYAGNRWGSNYHLEFTGVNHNNQDQADRVDGDIHVEGDIWLGGDASAHRFGQLDCTGRIVMLNPLNEIDHNLGGGLDDSLTPPDLQRQGYDRASREFRSWDPSYQGSGRDVVHVGHEYDYYASQSLIQNILISAEGAAGEWNSTAQSLPDSAMANFFQFGYQNHYVDGFTAAQDDKIEATKNYYLGARNGGTTGAYGDRHGLVTDWGNPYGGGHAVIEITEAQNNKVYFVDGNVWFDSDGCNHVFFVPGPGVDRVNITIVAKGNIYIGDQIFVTTNAVNDQQYSKEIGANTSVGPFQLTDPQSGIALIAMRDGESYNDINKNGKYDVGETIIGRDQPGTPLPAANNPSSGSGEQYRGRMEGSGNIIFGDTIQGPVGVVEAFMFAENNFCDITADTSQGSQNPYFFGNMTAGNRVYLNRNTEGWIEKNGLTVNGLPDGWTYTRSENGRTYYYPPGTNDQNWNDPFVTYRRIYNTGGNKYQVECSNHNPLDLKYDDRLEQGVINLPGLPTANTSVDGSWKILVWRQY